MTKFQKEVIIVLNAVYNKTEFTKFANELFHALEINVIDYKPLAIPVADLDIEAILPVDVQISQITNGDIMAHLMRASIFFDLYIPSKKWVANLACVYAGKTGYLDSAIAHSVSETVSKVISAECGVFDHLIASHCTLKTILCDAVKAYLNKRDITHPLDCVSALKEKRNENSYLLASDKIDLFIGQIKK